MVQLARPCAARREEDGRAGDEGAHRDHRSEEAEADIPGVFERTHGFLSACSRRQLPTGPSNEPWNGNRSLRGLSTAGPPAPPRTHNKNT